MKTINYRDLKVPHKYAVEEESKGRSNPIQIISPNNTVAKVESPAPGIFLIESAYGGNDTEIISAGIHGDEMAGVIALSDYLTDILTGRALVRKNIIAFFGNLKALGQSREIKETGDHRDNLNRCWNQGIFNNPVNSAQKRANIITRIILDAINIRANNIASDFHQSFDMPTVREVRMKDGMWGNSEYDFMVTNFLKGEIKKGLEEIKNRISNIIAGVVINEVVNFDDLTTFSGFCAALGAFSGTYEMGTIGREGGRTYCPQLMSGTASRIAGYDLSDKAKEKFDTWISRTGIIKQDDDFIFLDSEGNPTNKDPRDFLVVPQKLARQNGRDIVINEKDRIVFANKKVPKGDRAGLIISPAFYEDYTNEWMRDLAA